MTFLASVKSELTKQDPSPYSSQGFAFPKLTDAYYPNFEEQQQFTDFMAAVVVSCAQSTIKETEQGTTRESGYRLELLFENEQNAKTLCEMLAEYEIFPKLTTRNNIPVIYIKSSDCICNLLALTGATNSMLRLSNEIALRTIRNDANRIANCDTANISKQVTASDNIIKKIQQLKSDGTFDILPVTLQECANARLTHPDATYEELAQILNLTKSGLASRLRRLSSMSFRGAQ